MKTTEVEFKVVGDRLLMTRHYSSPKRIEKQWIPLGDIQKVDGFHTNEDEHSIRVITVDDTWVIDLNTTWDEIEKMLVYVAAEKNIYERKRHGN